MNSESETSYNHIAGRSLERIAALSDGLFAIAVTLIVLEIRVPVHEGIHTEAALWVALTALAPRAVTYLLSFMTLGIFWVGQQTQLSHFEHSNRHLTWIHLGFLALVAVIPFSTELLAEFISFRIALLLYWLNILLLGVMLYASWSYASRAGLIKADAPAGVSVTTRRRIVVAQVLYASGAALCFINTYWSIGFIVLIQLYYTFGPRLPYLTRRLR